MIFPDEVGQPDDGDGYHVGGDHVEIKALHGHHQGSLRPTLWLRLSPLPLQSAALARRFPNSPASGTITNIVISE